MKFFFIILNKTIHRYKSLIHALMFFFLFLALQEQVKKVINTCLLPIFDIQYHWALNVFMCMAIIGMIYDICNSAKKKSVNIGECMFTYWLVAIFVYYRFFDDSYCFILFYGDIAYLDVIACYLILRTCFCLCRQEKAWWNERLKKGIQSENKPNSLLVYQNDENIKSYKEDIFNLKPHIEKILHFLDTINVSEKACSIGLVGKWGYGKSSFLELLKRSLEERERRSRIEYTPLSKKTQEYLTMEFNPRNSKKLDKIQEDFLNGLKETLSSTHMNLTRIFEDYAETLDISTNTQPIISFLIRLFQIHRKSWQESFNSINEIIRLSGKRVLVLIDDLDRLTGKELMEVMKVINKNGAFANLIFISAYDKEYINGALRAYLQQEIDTYYTDKYFETEIQIPDHAYFKLREYILKSLMNAHDNGMLRPEKNEISRVIANCDSHLEKRLHNLRDVKRFVNQLLLHYQINKQGVVFRDYLLLQLIRIEHPDEYDKLRKYEYVEKEGVGAGSIASQELLYLKPKYHKNSKTPNQSLPKSVDILRSLFPTKENYKNGWYDNRFQRIFSINSFDVYFYNYEYNHLLQNDFDSLYDCPLNEACNRISEWKSFSQDLESYLFTRKLERFKTKEYLKRYFQLLLYGNYLFGGINYIILGSSFLKKKNFEEIRAKYNFVDRDEYLTWIQDALVDFLYINSNIIVEYLQYIITSMIKDSSLEEQYEYSYHKIQKVALVILELYLKNINKEEWKSYDAFALLLHINDGKTENIHEPAAVALRTSMKDYPEKYISALSPIAVQIPNNKTNLERVKFSFTERFIVKKIFPDIQEFEDWLNDIRLNEVQDIDFIRRFWIHFKANSCQPIIVEGDKPKTIEEILKMIEKSAE